MAAERIRVLVFGGDPFRWVRRGMEDFLEWDGVTAKSAEAVFVLGRFISGAVKRQAQAAAESSGAARIIVMSPHHMVAELKKNPRFASRIEALERERRLAEPLAGREQEQGNVTEQEPKAPAPPQDAPTPSSPPLATGIPTDELWAIYRAEIIKSVRAIFVVNEKMRERDFLPVLSEAVGIAEPELREILPMLAMKGILVHIGGETWKLLPEVGTEYAYDGDTEELPEPEQPEPGRRTLAQLVAGFPEGPYKSKYAIEQRIIECPEFVTRQGVRLSRGHAHTVVEGALRIGVVLKDGEQYVIAHDESVRLSPPDPAGVRPEAMPSTPLKDEAATPAAAPPAAAAKDEPTPAPQAEDKPLKVSDDLRFLRGAVGAALIQEPKRADVMHARALIAPAHWDECATNTILKRLRLSGVSPRPLPRELFSEDEWAALAWETARAFTLETVVPIMRRQFQDERLSCAACGAAFVFERGEAEYFFNKGLAKPRRCQACRGRGAEGRAE